MDAPLIIAIIVAVLVVIVALTWIARRQKAAHLEERRVRAAETRDLAAMASLDADRQAAEAAERAARAEHERLSAEQQQLEADRQRQEATDLHQQADELDPDVDLDADGINDADSHDPTVVDPADLKAKDLDRSDEQAEVDLRQADRTQTS